MTKETPKHGLYIEYYDSGHTRVEISYKYDELHGNYYEWYENGQKKLEGNYKEIKSIEDECEDWLYRRGPSLKHGKFTVWDKNGQIVSEANYKDGEDENDIPF
jgi:antitoxin component YwqK of YwqJK toxin-antitoxin module